MKNIVYAVRTLSKDPYIDFFIVEGELEYRNDHSAVIYGTIVYMCSLEGKKLFIHESRGKPIKQELSFVYDSVPSSPYCNDRIYNSWEELLVDYFHVLLKG